MRTVLASILLLALLAGCSAPNDAAESADDAAPTQPPADLNDSVDVDLLDGGFDQTWSFDYADGAIGYFTVNLNTRLQGLIEPTACVVWTRTFPGGEARGNSGECSQGGGNIQIGIGGDLLDDRRQIFHIDGDDLRPGHYTVHVTAPVQANRLAVFVGIDNPPTETEAPGPSA